MYAEYSGNPFKIRAKSLLSLAGEMPARSKKNLCRKLNIIDNPLITCINGKIAEISKTGRFADVNDVLDLGEACLAPGLVNCHCHLQLSWLKGKLEFGKGFTAWLKSLVPHLLSVPANAFKNNASIQINALDLAFQELVNTHTAFLGDITGSISGALTKIAQKSRQFNIETKFFCEWFGFFDNKDSIWPVRCKEEAETLPEFNLMPAGHALYSTMPEILVKAHDYCKNNNKIFSIHLAESLEETDMLENAKGKLLEYYMGKVIPEKWHAPHLRPFAFARKLGLLDNATLAVHCVQLDESEIGQLGESGATVCLCPRSNENIGVGTSNAWKMIEKNILLCLGTDGLTSNTDLDIRKEACFLQKKQDIPASALIRMMTVNGMEALKMDCRNIWAVPGGMAKFSILPENFL